jgi:VIT1/CCC1 family predicted Fe2+/Mn2+ transporter
MEITRKVARIILQAQKNEITEYHIYNKLAKRTKGNNRDILEKIATEELDHYHRWKKFTNKDAKPRPLKIWFYYMISRAFGLTFGLKLMERGEEGAQEFYGQLNLKSEEVEKIIHEEHEHEDKILQMLDEDFLKYTSSMVLGLNDALVELTGALAGFTLALKNSRLIALVGLVTGIAASLSMASSEYLSTAAEGGEKSPLKASVFTGIAYVLTVLILISPYLLFGNYFVCLIMTLSLAVIIIFLFNYYISVARDLSFKIQFIKMAGLSLGVAALSFLIGFLLRSFFAVDV